MSAGEDGQVFHAVGERLEVVILFGIEVEAVSGAQDILGRTDAVTHPPFEHVDPFLARMVHGAFAHPPLASANQNRLHQFFRAPTREQLEFVTFRCGGPLRGGFICGCRVVACGFALAGHEFGEGEAESDGDLVENRQRGVAFSGFDFGEESGGASAPFGESCQSEVLSPSEPSDFAAVGVGVIRRASRGFWWSLDPAFFGELLGVFFCRMGHRGGEGTTLRDSI